MVTRVAIAIPGWTPAEPLQSVLLVSADPNFRAVAGRVLRRECYAAETVAHTGHALLACMRQPFDIILIDEPSVERAESVVAGMLKHSPGAIVVPMVERPRDADQLLELVATACLPVGTAHRPAVR